MANVLVTVSVQDQLSIPLNGVYARVYEADGETFVAEAVTGAPFADGVAELTLFGDSPAVDYVLRLFISGYRFDNNELASTISVDDPAVDNDFGPFTARLGASATLARIHVIDDDDDPVDGVLVRIYDSADVFVSEGTSGAGGEQPGEVSILLSGSADPGTLHIIRLLASDAVVQGGMTQALRVINPLTPPQLNEFDFVVVATELPAPSDVDLCRIYGRLVDGSLRPLKGKVLEFTPRIDWPTPSQDQRVGAAPLGSPTVLRQMVIAAPVRAISDANGYVDVELPRGASYNVRISGQEHPVFIIEQVEIPDEASFALEELLFPYVVSVEYNPIPTAVAVDETLDVEVVVTLSNTQQVMDLRTMGQLLDFSSSDPEVLDVIFSGATTISIRGVAGGSADIQVERKPSSYAPRRPDVSPLIVTPPTVVVT